MPTSVGAVNNDTISTVSNTSNNNNTKKAGFEDAFNKACEKLKDVDLEAIYKKASETYGVPEDFLKAVTKAESDFNPNDTSKSGAMGLMQLMPYEVEELGITDPYDPEQNVMGGAKLFKKYLDRYDGNVPYALAAYNAGGPAVTKYDGIPPYEETKKYIVNVLSYLQNSSLDLTGKWVASTNEKGGITVTNSGGVETFNSITSTTNTTDSTTSVNPTTGTDQTLNSSSDSVSKEATIEALKEQVSKLFTYDDYLDFLKLFIQVIEDKLEEKGISLGDNSDNASTANNITSEESNSTSSGTTIQSVSLPESDASVAFRNMTAANKSIIYLNPLQ